MTAALDPTSRRCSRRSHRLGADRRITNFAGGQHVGQGDARRSGHRATTRVLVVKGSGGDLGTLAAEGLALLDLDRIRALERLSTHRACTRTISSRYYELVPLRHRWRGAVDRHAVARVPRRRPRRSHPSRCGDRTRSGRRRRRRLVSDCYGDDVRWLDWRRPGFELGAACSATSVAATPGRARCRPRWSRTHLLGCDERRVRSHDSRPRRPRRSVPRRNAARRTARRDGRVTCRPARARPAIGGRAARARRARHRRNGPPAGRALHRLARRPRLPESRGVAATWPPGHVVPGPLPHHEGPATVARPSAERTVRGTRCAAARAARAVPRRLRRVLRRSCHRRLAADARRGPRRSSCSRVSGCGASAPTRRQARVAGEFFVNAINVMRGAESVSSYQPIDDAEKFRVEYWELEEAQAPSPPCPASARRAGRVRHRRGVGHRARHRRTTGGSRARASSSPTSTATGREGRGRSSATDRALAVSSRRHRRGRGRPLRSRPRRSGSAASTSW